MGNFFKDLGRNLLPTLGNVIVGTNPIMGGILSAVTNKRSTSKGSDKVLELIEGATKGKANSIPEMIELYHSDKEFRKELIEIENKNQVDLLKLQVEDTKNARSAEINRIKASDSWITQNATTILALIIVLAYFSTQAVILLKPTVVTTLGNNLNAILDFQKTIMVLVMGYYFGTSRSSGKKDEFIHKAMTE